jgi:thiol-disulfide isomerase/thioredoxin
MPSIGAELIGTDLSADQAGWTLEGPDGVKSLAAALPRDTLVFLNFWATWCGPCREELPSMFRLRQELADRRFKMVAVSYDESWDDIRQAFQRWFQRTPTPEQLEVLRDPNLDDGKTLRETFGTTKIPDTYVLLNGRILARFVNARDWTDPNIVSYFRTLAPAL